MAKTIKVTNNNSKKTILEHLEGLGVTSIHSECRDGYCGACKCTVIGDVDYPNGDPIAYLNPEKNEATLCTATIPINSEVIVKIC